MAVVPRRNRNYALQSKRRVSRRTLKTLSCKLEASARVHRFLERTEKTAIFQKQTVGNGPMPLCGKPTRKGTPCRNKVQGCWKHRGIINAIQQNETLTFWMTVAALILSITGPVPWQRIAHVFEPTPITKQTLEALRERPAVRPVPPVSLKGTAQ